MIVNIINGLITGLALVKATEVLINKKYEINKRNIAILTLFTIIIVLIYTNVDNFLKMVLVFLDYVLITKMICKETHEKSLVIAFIEYINVMIAECIIGIILGIAILIINSLTQNNIEMMKNTIILNITIMSLSYLLVYKFQKFYNRIIQKVTNNSVLILMGLATLILVCMGSLFYKIDISKWQLNSEFILNAVVIMAMGIVGFFIIIQRLEYDKKNNQYKDLAKYSEINAELLEEYSMLNHEHQNQLIIIDGMIKDKDKELEKYVKTLIEKKEKIKFKWIKELNNISFQGLKSFMNYKILEMKKQKIKVNVLISKECKGYKLEKLSPQDKDRIYSIMGVILDNAKEAASESKEKTVTINAYCIEKELYFEIANTFEGKIDLEQINDYGYTSKGTGRGTGLYMVHSLIKDSKKFKISTRIHDKYFVQTLVIKI